MALPVLTALARMHAAGICHRDIKPEHLMIDNGHLKIGDFGNAGCTTAAAASLCASSIRQQPQQQSSLTFKSYDGGVGKPSDQSHTVAVTVAACSGSGAGCEPAPAAPVLLAPAASFCSSPAQRDAMNFRTGSIEYMAPEMLDKPTSAEVFHLVSSSCRSSSSSRVYSASHSVLRSRAHCCAAHTGSWMCASSLRLLQLPCLPAAFQHLLIMVHCLLRVVPVRL